MVSELSCEGEQVPRVLAGVQHFASQLPCLLLTDGEDCHIQNNVFNDKPLYYDVGSEIPALIGRDIGWSCGEWVLLKGSSDLHGVLVNLLSKETIELPLFDFEYNFCVLTSPPSDPACHIVCFNKTKNALIICQPGDKEFTIRNWDYEFFPNRVRAVIAGKVVLSIIEGRTFLVMVEFKQSTYRFEVVEMISSRGEFMSAQSYLFEYSGDLFILYKVKCGVYSFNVADFKIFKVDLLNKEWVRMKNLGRLAIFIGYGTAQVHCATVESGIMANSIYFLEEDDLDSYYVYNLEEGTIRMKPTLCYMETTEDSKLDWIMMPFDTSFTKLLKEDRVSIRQDSEKENKTSGEVEEDEVQESWNTVPPELLNLIQLSLFGRDHAVFRGVCKSWQQISIHDFSIPSLLSSTTFLEQCQSFSPLLMFQEDKTSSSVPTFRFFDPVHRNMYRVGIPELREVYIHYSKDGWLLVSRDQSIFFFNPLTQEKIELPGVPAGSYFSAYSGSLSFSSPPTCSNCLVVWKDHLGTTIHTLKHGDETWRAHSFNETRTEDFKEYVCNPVMLNGLHYFLCENREMVVLNLKDGAEGQLTDCQSWLSKFKRTEYLRVEDFLVEIDGGLAFVSIEPDEGEINIYKWNDMEKDWEFMEGGVEFGGKEMFLSRRSSFMEKIDDAGRMGNTIFLPMIDDAKDGVFYSLATGRYHTFYSSYSSERPYDVDKFLDGIWVMPDRKIVGDKNLKW